MELGISSLGYFNDLALSGKIKSLKDMQINATEHCLNFAEEYGIRIVELIIDPPEVLNNEYQVEMVDLINSYSLKKQVHGPYIDVNLCSCNGRILMASIESNIETIKICHQIDAEIMTIHPGIASYTSNSIRELNKTQLKKSIHKLLDFTSKQQLLICMENMPQNAYIMTDNRNINEVFDTIGREDLFLTYDTSHFYTCNGNVKKLWAKFHDTIKNVHIVENFSKNSDTHPPLGTGKIDFKEIFETIKNYSYRGPIIVELSSANSLNQSINFIKKFL